MTIVLMIFTGEKVFYIIGIESGSIKSI